MEPPKPGLLNPALVPVLPKGVVLGRLAMPLEPVEPGLIAPGFIAPGFIGPEGLKELDGEVGLLAN